VCMEYCAWESDDPATGGNSRHTAEGDEGSEGEEIMRFIF
jgi:hypothetical protein